MPLGFRIRPVTNRATPEDIGLFVKLPTSIVSDAMSRKGALRQDIRPLSAPTPGLLGPAFTVKTRPTDNLMVHKALDMALAGDVLVIDAEADKGCAIIGEIMCRYAKKRGIAGVVLNGLVRDTAALRGMDFPVYCLGSSPLGPYKDGPGEIGFAVSCGGVLVNPGDIVLADEDGVVIVPKDGAASVAKASEQALAAESTTFAQIESGTLERGWVDKTLLDRGCEFIK